MLLAEYPSQFHQDTYKVQEIKLIWNKTGNLCINVTLWHVCVTTAAMEKR
jgi:hypothetical protein